MIFELFAVEISKHWIRVYEKFKKKHAFFWVIECFSIFRLGKIFVSICFWKICTKNIFQLGK